MPVDRALRERALDTGEASVLVGVFPTVLAGCAAMELWRDEMVCAVRDGHPRVGRRLTLKVYTELPHVLVSLFGGESGNVDRALAALDRKRVVGLTVPFFAASAAATATSDFIATLPLHFARAVTPGFGLRLLKPPVAVDGFTMSAMWHQRMAADPAEVFFRDAVRAASRALTSAHPRRVATARSLTIGSMKK